MTSQSGLARMTASLSPALLPPFKLGGWSSVLILILLLWVDYWPPNMTYNTWGSTQLEELCNNLGIEYCVCQASRQAPWGAFPWIPEGGRQ